MFCKIAHLMNLPPLSNMGISKRVAQTFNASLEHLLEVGKNTHNLQKKSKDQLLQSCRKLFVLLHRHRKSHIASFTCHQNSNSFITH